MQRISREPELKQVISLDARTLWTAAGVAFVAGLLWTIGAQIISELLLLFGAVVIAEGMRPLVELLVRNRLPRALAILCIVVIAIAFIAGLAWLILAPLIAQVADLISDIPHFAAVAQGDLDRYQRFLHNNLQARQLLAQLPSRISSFLTSKIGYVIEAPLVAVSTIANVVLVLLIMFFWLMASRDIATFTLSLARPENRPIVRSVLDELSTKLGGYLRGLLINMTVIGILSGVGVELLGVPYALLLGVVAAFTEAIPIVGPVISGGIAVIVAFLALGTAKSLQVALLYLAIQQIEGNTLVPFVMNRVVAINPLAIIVALLIGSSLLGIPGAVLSVPGAAVLQVIITRIIAPNVRKRFNVA